MLDGQPQLRVEKVLFYADPFGRYPVLWYDGERVQFDLEEVSPDLRDILAERSLPKGRGFYVWEGVVRYLPPDGPPWDPGEPDVVWDGEIRPATREEIEMLSASA